MAILLSKMTHLMHGVSGFMYCRYCGAYQILLPADLRKDD